MSLFDRFEANGNLNQLSDTETNKHMSIRAITEAVEAAFLAKQQIKILDRRIQYLESQHDLQNHDGWMTLEQASQQLGKTVAAIRQKIKHKKQPMPEGIVWKQHSKFAPIYVNLRAFREHM
ncbi:hypothetical protein D9981_01555 [Pseudoalteromonas phenolica O-BC30]|nr:hypothetical protein D9981_01555 [Pseudoalteromonas phenolica O-BC30]